MTFAPSKPFKLTGCATHYGKEHEKCALCGKEAWLHHPTISVCGVDQGGNHFRVCWYCFEELRKKSLTTNKP